MAFWNRHKPTQSSETRGTIESPGVPINAQNILALLGWDTAGVAVNEDSAQGVPALWCGVNFIAATVAALPLNLYKRVGENERERADDPLQALLHDAPNNGWTSYGWRRYSMERTLLGGRQLTWIERNASGWPVALWPLVPSCVRIERRATDAGPVVVYHYTEGGARPKTYAAADVIDVPWKLKADQVSHVDPIQRLRSAIGLAVAMQEYAERYFANGGIPPLALEGPMQSPGAIQRASGDMTKAVQNASSARSQVLAIPAGHVLKPLGFDPEKGQMTEARLFQLQEIARMLGLSPIFLQDLTHGTMANTEQQDLHVVKHTLTQWLRCIEQELNLKLFPTVEKRREYFVEFNVDGLLRGDYKTRMEGNATAVEKGLLTPDEIRARENLPPAPGGDKLYMQSQMMPLNAPRIPKAPPKGDTP